MTRRELMAALCVSPVSLGVAEPLSSKTAGVEIVTESHCLALESRAGFEYLSKSQARLGSPVIILTACRSLTIARALELQRFMQAGARVILETGLSFAEPPAVESQARILANVFDLHLGNPVNTSHENGRYVEYTWPRRALVRPFGSIFAVRCRGSETFARYDGNPVCVHKRVGRGDLFYLGSLIGASLLAGDSDSYSLCHHLVNSPKT